MARTKQTARKEKIDPRGIPAKIFKGQQSKGKTKLPATKPPATKPPLKKPPLKRRRFSQHVNCLREIRRAVKALGLAIPRLPFQRLCRQICDQRLISLRWQREALDCLQEAAEDFLIEFFQDSYICAAHAHRVTLMDKDMVVLRRLRYRFSKVLEPVPFRDEKTFNILNIPPWRRPKPEEGVSNEEEVKPKDMEGGHERQTRRQSDQDARRGMEEDKKAMEESEEQLAFLEQEVRVLFKKVNPNGFLVSAFPPDDIVKRQDYITLDHECLPILKDKKREINDTIVLASIR